MGAWGIPGGSHEWRIPEEWDPMGWGGGSHGCMGDPRGVPWVHEGSQKRGSNGWGGVP